MPARDRRRPFWSRWVWKDWDAKTKDLDPYEYTAYHRLLSYAATNSPDLCTIPDDDRRLARATGLGMKAWRRVRERVLSYWPLVAPGGDLSTHVDGIPRRFNEHQLEDASRFTKLVANNTSRVNRRGNRGSTAGSTGGHLRARGSEVRSQKSEEEESVNTLWPSSPNGSAWPDRFEKFWALWPTKQAKKAAVKAWRSLAPKGDGQALFTAITDGVERAKGSEQWKRGFIPNAAAYLNGERWKDEIAVPAKVDEASEGSELSMDRMKTLLAEKEAAREARHSD